MSHEAEKECVILVHGLGRTSRSMLPIKKFLEVNGYSVISCSYPTRSGDIREIANKHLGEAIREGQSFHVNGDKPNRLHFVTHSLGGILVRQYLQENPLKSLGKIVMLAPPNKGSELADFLGKYSMFRWILGETILQLGTNALPANLKPIQGTIGVIAGKSPVKSLFSFVFPGESDGKVSLSSTRLEEMADFLEVRSGHTFIMRKRQVLEEILQFLQHGCFSTATP